jgi:hypothetical protein
MLILRSGKRVRAEDAAAGGADAAAVGVAESAEDTMDAVDIAAAASGLSVAVAVVVAADAAAGERMRGDMQQTLREMRKHCMFKDGNSVTSDRLHRFYSLVWARVI